MLTLARSLGLTFHRPVMKYDRKLFLKPVSAAITAICIGTTCGAEQPLSAIEWLNEVITVPIVQIDPAATNEPPVEIDMRSYAAEIDTQLHDIRNLQVAIPDIYDSDPAHYGAARSFARKLRDAGSNGIVYSSVRDLDGECIAVFRPSVMSPVVQGKHYCYVWDGERIANVYVKTEYPE